MWKEGRGHPSKSSMMWWVGDPIMERNCQAERGGGGGGGGGGAPPGGHKLVRLCKL